jgi:hypothetical protein
MGQNFLAADREQAFLLPPDVREWLPDRVACDRRRRADARPSMRKVR